MEIPPFPEDGEKDGELVEVSLEELLLNRRGIAEGNSTRFRLVFVVHARIKGRVVIGEIDERGRNNQVVRRLVSGRLCPFSIGIWSAESMATSVFNLEIAN